MPDEAPQTSQAGPSWIRPLFGVLGGIAGALIGAPLFAMVGAQIATWLWGTFEGAAAMDGGEAGAAIGLFAGLFGGTWAVLRDNGRHAGHVVTFLWIGVVMVAGCIAFVAFS